MHQIYLLRIIYLLIKKIILVLVFKMQSNMIYEILSNDHILCIIHTQNRILRASRNMLHYMPVKIEDFSKC